MKFFIQILLCLILFSCNNKKDKIQKLTSGKVFVDLGTFKDSVEFNNLVDTLNNYEAIQNMSERICEEAKRELKYGATFKPAGPVFISGKSRSIIPKELRFDNIEKYMKKIYGDDYMFKMSSDEWSKTEEKVKDSISKLYNLKIEHI